MCMLVFGLLDIVHSNTLQYECQATEKICKVTFQCFLNLCRIIFVQTKVCAFLAYPLILTGPSIA